MNKLLIYRGKLLMKLPELLHKKIGAIIEELNQNGIQCTRPTYRNWAEKDIKMSTLIAICNLYHIPIYYFFEFVRYPKTDDEYRLVEGHWIPIEIDYTVVIHYINEKYGNRQNAIRQHAIAENRYDEMKRNDLAALKNVMASDIEFFVNEYQIPIIFVIIDKNVPFRKEKDSEEYVCAIAGYEEVFRLSEENATNKCSESFQDKLTINKLRQENMDLRYELEVVINTLNNIVGRNRAIQMKKGKL